MKRLFRLFIIAVFAAVSATNAIAQTETSDEMFVENRQPVILELRNIERLQYVIYVDARGASVIEGYKLNRNNSWSATDNLIESRTIILDGLEPGLHTVMIEAFQDADRKKARKREEYLHEFEPLIFTINADPAKETKHVIDVHSGLRSKAVAHERFEYAENMKKKWQTNVNAFGGQELEFRVKQYRKKDKLGRVTRRLDSRGMWSKAQKYINYVDLEVLLNGVPVLAEEKVAYSGRVEYKQWDYIEGKYYEKHFLHNTIKDETRIQQFVRTIPLTDAFELRITAYDQEVAYSVIRTGDEPAAITADDD